MLACRATEGWAQMLMCDTRQATQTANDVNLGHQKKRLSHRHRLFEASRLRSTNQVRNCSVSTQVSFMIVRAVVHIVRGS
jgi:hypothetical protein